MKRFLALMLAAVMTLSLAACGGGGDNDTSNGLDDTAAPVTEPQDETESSVEEPKTIILGMNETVVMGDELELYTDSFVIREKRVLDSNTTVTPSDGYWCATFYFSAKNVGKAEISIPNLSSYIEYGDGYTFNGEPGVINETLAPLTEAEVESIYYYIPPEAFHNKENPMSIVLKWGDEKYVIPIRPTEEQTDKYYESVDSLIADGWTGSAIGMLEISGIYDRYPIVLSNELQSFLQYGPVNMQNNFDYMSLWHYDRKSFRDVNFHEEGTYDFDYEETVWNFTWSIDGDAFIFHWWNDRDYLCEVRKLSDNAYLLVCDGSPVRILWRESE